MATIKDPTASSYGLSSPGTSYNQTGWISRPSNRISSQTGPRHRPNRLSKSDSTSASPKPSPSATMRNARISQIAQSRLILNNFGNRSYIPERPMSWHVPMYQTPVFDGASGFDDSLSQPDDTLYSAISSDESPLAFHHQHSYRDNHDSSIFSNRHTIHFEPGLFMDGFDTTPAAFVSNHNIEFDNHLNFQHTSAPRREEILRINHQAQIQDQSQLAAGTFLLASTPEETHDDIRIEEDLVGLGLYDDDKEDETTINNISGNTVLFGSSQIPRKALRLEQEWRPPQTKSDTEYSPEHVRSVDENLSVECFDQSYQDLSAFDQPLPPYSTSYGTQFPYVDMDVSDEKGLWYAGAEQVYYDDSVMGFNYPYTFMESVPFV